MIDLMQPTLPSALVVDGAAYEVDTSFRTWVRFQHLLREGVAWAGVFPGDVPEGRWVEAAVEFLESPNATPRGSRGGGPRTIDLVLDGEYVVAAFQQAYGIDLTTGDMHWHRFKALLNGLPEDTRLSQIMGFRAYRKPPGQRDSDAYMRERQREWRLPEPGEDEARADMLEWAETFFGD